MEKKTEKLCDGKAVAVEFIVSLSLCLCVEYRETLTPGGLCPPLLATLHFPFSWYFQWRFSSRLCRFIS